MNHHFKPINTSQAPSAIGTYSQAIRSDDTIYISGQIPMEPGEHVIMEGTFAAQLCRVFENLSAIAHAAGGSLKDVVKLNIYLTDLAKFTTVNEMMARYFSEPYPARAVIGVAALPKNAPVEMDAIMVLKQRMDL